ncbi:trypsin-like peptidase domain-containing protein [Paludifilum halophilum]|uniref:Uncharacterized protein n=1 Tax=Paludifilum halophilum TaxID=1642702 RepID=A0A235B9F0_9BACL|nr:trypsin-like peptidase domain-containing protein [Paludifilum halophilum]OYD08517.1 hypothetical protein CHM34_06735 [Paludifilum halophilum]
MDPSFPSVFSQPGSSPIKNIREGFPAEFTYDVLRYDYAVLTIDPEYSFDSVYNWSMRADVDESEQVVASGYPNDYQCKSIGGITNYDSLFDVIQHGAFIDHGYSGGPLWNVKSGVGRTQIGINVAGSGSEYYACALDEDTQDLNYNQKPVQNNMLND